MKKGKSFEFSEEFSKKFHDSLIEQCIETGYCPVQSNIRGTIYIEDIPLEIILISPSNYRGRLDINVDRLVEIYKSEYPEKYENILKNRNSILKKYQKAQEEQRKPFLFRSLTPITP